LALTAPVRELMQGGQIDMGHARALLALSGMQQVEVAREVVARGLSVRETERLVGVRVRGGNSKRGSLKTKDRDVLRLQESLAEKLGAKVQFDHGAKGKGKVIIHYNSLDELQGILAHIK
jgi:ParB family chromosome partitioning protein